MIADGRSLQGEGVKSEQHVCLLDHLCSPSKYLSHMNPSRPVNLTVHWQEIIRSHSVKKTSTSNISLEVRFEGEVWLMQSPSWNLGDLCITSLFKMTPE